MVRRGFVDQVFENQELDVDGSIFERCKFKHCRITFSAIDRVTFKECTFTECEWIFSGSAEVTLAYLSALYRVLGPAGKELVEDIVQGIRDGTIVSQTSNYYERQKVLAG